MQYFKTMIDETLADDKLKLLGMEALGARHLLMCYLGKSPVLNWLYRTETEIYQDSEIAILLAVELQKWLQIKERLLKYGGFALNDSNAVGIPKWAEHQSDYYRQLKYRQITKLKTKGLHIEVRSKKKEEDIGEPAPQPPQGDPAAEIIDYLNLKAGRHFSRTNQAHLKFIKARLKEGITPELLKKIIDRKTWEWQDKYKDKDRYPDGRPAGEKDMSEWIRPETLFNATKCASYVEQAIRFELGMVKAQQKKVEYKDSPRADLKKKINEEAFQETERKVNQLKKEFGGQWFLHYKEQP